jgi:chromosome segregation ATPase
MKIIFQSRQELKVELSVTYDDIRSFREKRQIVSDKLVSITSAIKDQVIDGVTAEKDKIPRLEGELEEIDNKLLTLSAKARKIKKRLDNIDNKIKSLTSVDAELCRQVYVEGKNISQAIEVTIKYCDEHEIKSSSATLWRLWKKLRLEDDRIWIKK